MSVSKLISSLPETTLDLQCALIDSLAEQAKSSLRETELKAELARLGQLRDQEERDRN